MTPIAVAIVNYNTCDLLARCLETLFAQESTVGFEVWVVDNASRDGSVAMLQARFPQVRVIANSENLGFAAANNQVMREAEAEAVFLLNTDTEMRPGALQALWEALNADPRNGMAAASLSNPDGSPQPSVVPARFPWAFAPIDREERLRWASGCALLVRSQTIREIGMLDERFFYTGEDCDWGLRARRAGWHVVACPKSVVMHLGGATRKDLPHRTVEAIQLGRQHYFSKHYGLPGLCYARLHTTIELTGEILKKRRDVGFYLGLLGRCWRFRPEARHG